LNESPLPQGRAVRQVIMNHQGTLARLALNLINTPLRESGLIFS